MITFYYYMCVAFTWIYILHIIDRAIAISIGFKVSRNTGDDLSRTGVLSKQGS